MNLPLTYPVFFKIEDVDFSIFSISIWRTHHNLFVRDDQV